jgi:phosphoribosylglycinamide formyltransferase-1
VAPDDDEDSLSARILTAEHRCYPLAVRLIAEGRVKIDGNRTRIDGPLPPDCLIVPAG